MHEASSRVYGSDQLRLKSSETSGIDSTVATSSTTHADRPSVRFEDTNDRSELSTNLGPLAEKAGGHREPQDDAKKRGMPLEQVDTEEQLVAGTRDEVCIVSMGEACRARIGQRLGPDPGVSRQLRQLRLRASFVGLAGGQVDVGHRILQVLRLQRLRRLQVGLKVDFGKGSLRPSGSDSRQNNHADR